MRLRVFPPAGSPSDFDLTGSLTIGRDKKCDITIDDAKSSSKHAVIEVTRSGKVQLRDLQSTNGTTMNGSKVEADLVVTGDVVMIGEHRFMLWHGERAPVLPADDPKGWRLLPRADDGDGPGDPCGIVGSLTVGRSPESGLPIDHATVSAHHATITVTPDGLNVEDHGSSNGTWVGGTKVRRSALKHGDVVAFGDVAFFAQHGTRELPQVKEVERRNLKMAVLAVASVLAAGILGITVWQNRSDGPVAPPLPAPAPAPAVSPNSGNIATRAKAGVLAMDAKGRFSVTASSGAKLTNGAMVLLNDSGAVIAHQHDADAGPGRDRLVVAHTAEGLLNPTADTPIPFKLSGGLTPAGLLTIEANAGVDGVPTVAGLRIDLPAGTVPVATHGPAGHAKITGDFSVAEAEELLLESGGKPFALQFDAPWSVRGRPAGGGWEILIWKRGDTKLMLGLELGGRPMAEREELARIRSRAEAAMAREEYAAAVTLWRELLTRVGDDDAATPELRIRLEEAQSAAKK